jgi:ABC-type nitrate/sulfonate/bicarbonate transport system substrate-binding protein
MTLVVAAMVAVVPLGGTVVSPPGVQAAEPVTVLSGFSVGFMVAYVAEKEKLFEKEGVPVKMQYSVSGKAAVDAMVAGAGVMAISGAFPAVSAAAAAPVYVVAPITRDDASTKLIVRSSIQSVTDLKGKRVGYQFGSDGHLVMLRYLEKNGMTLGDIASQNVPAEGLVAAFARGDLDGLAVWEPHAGKALEAVPGAKILASKGVVTIFNVVTMRKDFVEAQPEMARKLLRALVAANDFIKTNVDRAAQYTAEIGKIDVAQVKQIMPAYTYDMTLDPAFYDGMDAVASFLQARGLTKLKADPRNFVFDRLMRGISPSLVK